MSSVQRTHRLTRLFAALTIAALVAVMAWAGYRSPTFRTTMARWLNVAPSPHEHYVSMLRASGLDRTALGSGWIAAGEASLTKPAAVETPFHETGVFPDNAVHAVAYRLNLRRGRRLEVDVRLDGAANGKRGGPGASSGDGATETTGSSPSTAGPLAPPRVFVDLFRADGEHPPVRVASRGEDASRLLYDVPEDGVYLLRVQPELLRGGRFTLTQRTLATLRFPISGSNAGGIQSFFGDERDAGARAHQGVDIFAPKGTAAVAVVDGFARPDTNGLGGTVVWLHDPSAGRTFYYAHLDRWAFDAPSYVRAGDIIGYVGNTGNARGTSPHLHFGIYERGAIDPLPFIRSDEELPVTRDTEPSPSQDEAAHVRPELVEKIADVSAGNTNPEREVA